MSECKGDDRHADDCQHEADGNGRGTCWQQPNSRAPSHTVPPPSRQHSHGPNESLSAGCISPGSRASSRPALATSAVARPGQADHAYGDADGSPSPSGGAPPRGQGPRCRCDVHDGRPSIDSPDPGSVSDHGRTYGSRNARASWRATIGGSPRRPVPPRKIYAVHTLPFRHRRSTDAWRPRANGRPAALPVQSDAVSRTSRAGC